MGKDTASRILDAAETLLVAYGYRKVTIDEVAGRAGVGKGTLYLYWPSKRELFAAVLARETAHRVAEQLAALAADPAEVRLHRALRRTFLQTMRSPLARALATGDYAVLGEVLTASDGGSRFIFGKLETATRYLALLHRHGLVADDPAADPTLLHRLTAVILGAYQLEQALSVHDGAAGPVLDLEGRADALVITLRRAFEPATEPTVATLRAAAGELADLHTQWLADLADALPETTPLGKRGQPSPSTH